MSVLDVSVSGVRLSERTGLMKKFGYLALLLLGSIAFGVYLTFLQMIWRFLMRVCELRNIMNHYLNVVLALLFVIFSSIASAVEIDFDDIEAYHDPEWGCFCDHPLTTEYQDKGLLISDGFLVGEKRMDGTNDNSLLGSVFLTFTFVDNFPTRVSMIINAVHDQAVFLDAYGNNGWSDYKKTSGYAGPFDDTPYQPNQRVTFYAVEGITSISFSTFYGLRVGAIVDNLQYSYLELPEPSPALLLLPCLLLALTKRQKNHSRFRLGV